MRKYFVVLTLLFPLLLSAQSKVLKIEDTRNPQLYPTRLDQLQFRGEDNAYVFVNKESQSLMQGSPEKTNGELLTLAGLNKHLKDLGEPELKGFPYIQWLNKNAFTYSEGATLWKFDLNKLGLSKVGSMEEGAEDQDMASNGNTAYTMGGNLFILNAETGKKMQVSTDGTYELVYGKSAHRQEFGITKGTFWTNSGSKLAFYRMDQTDVTNYPFEEYNGTPATEKKIKYPMAGQKSHYVTVGVYDLKTGKTVYMETGTPKEQYLTNVTWSPDEKYIYIAIVNRDQNFMSLNRYDASTGKLDKTLFTESSTQYVEPEHGPVFIPNKTDFLWYSERDNWQHLYLYNADGTLVKQLTKGDWMVEEVLGFDKKGENVILSATKDGSISLHGYRVNLSSGEMTKLTAEEGTHTLTLSKSGEYLLDTYSNLTTPSTTLYTEVAKNKVVRTLHTSDNPLKDYKTGQVSFFPIKSTDGTTDLYCRVIKPIDFDPAKKYPVMYYVYGGPHAQMNHNAWLGGADMFMMYMAGQGYVVFTLDNRGSGGRGLAFEQATFRNLGKVEVEDQMAGVEWLKKQPWVDSERMGCFGWSFGGFMTTSMMLKKPDVFKAGVAGGPVIDWKFYEIMYTERYMDTPESNPEGYKNASLLNSVTNLKGKLLIIHGLQDDTVVPQHTAAFINECIAKGVLVDYFPYPNHPHNVRGKDRVHLYKKVEDYFKRNL